MELVREIFLLKRRSFVPVSVLMQSRNSFKLLKEMKCGLLANLVRNDQAISLEGLLKFFYVQILNLRALNFHFEDLSKKF